MALDQSALLELLGELKLTGVGDRIRLATETLYQELIDAEASAFIGAGLFERTPQRTTQRNGSRARTLTTTAQILSDGSRSCAPGPSSRHCLKGAAVFIGLCSRS